MDMQTLMQVVIIVILLLCGYFFLVQAAAKHTTNKAALPLISVLLLVIYGGIMTPVVVLINRMGSLSVTFLTLLMLISCIALFVTGYALVRNFREIDKKMLALFLVYLFAVGYITIYGRDGVTNDTAIRFQFAAIEEAVRTHSLEPLNHLGLNIAMFIPLGLLFPMIAPRKLDHISYGILLGLMTSTLIESIQMLLRIGQCDVEDILGNTLGALIGFLIYRLISRLRGRAEHAY